MKLFPSHAASRRAAAVSALVLISGTRLISETPSATFPSDYRGTPFDDQAYRAEQAAEADIPKQPFRTFAPALVWEAKGAAASGWVKVNGTPTATPPRDAESDPKKAFRFHASLSNYRYTEFRWRLEQPVALQGFDAVSFAIRVTGEKRPQEMFFTLDQNQGVPVSLRDLAPDLTDGSWHAITVPLRSLKLTDAQGSERQAREFLFSTFVWDPADFDIELDHFSFDRALTPPLPTTTSPRPKPALPPTLPGRLEAAFYDLGGEGVAYHDTTPINILSGVLNQQRRHQRSHATAYDWNFRREEGVDISFTKDWADLNHPNLVDPPTNQLYIGGTEDGEWCNYTVTVAKAGTYRIIAAYGNDANGKTFSFDVNHAPACVCTAPVVTGNMHHWNRAEVGTLTFPSAGKHLLTLHYGRGFNLGYFDFVALP